MVLVLFSPIAGAGEFTTDRLRSIKYRIEVMEAYFNYELAKKTNIHTRCTAESIEFYQKFFHEDLDARIKKVMGFKEDRPYQFVDSKYLKDVSLDDAGVLGSAALEKLYYKRCAADPTVAQEVADFKRTLSTAQAERDVTRTKYGLD